MDRHHENTPYTTMHSIDADEQNISDLEDDERDQMILKKKKEQERVACNQLHEFVYNRLEIVFEKHALRLRDPAFWLNDSNSEISGEACSDISEHGSSDDDETP